MVNYTPNLNLAKPTLSDVADITVISANFDILDSALAKMVTTDSPQEITGSKTFSGTVIVNGHNLRNAVTTDEEQTITGQKIFSAPNFNELIGVKSTNRVDGAIGAISFYNSNGDKVSNLCGRADGTIYTDGTIPANANSKTFVTKAYVESTDGVTNNLVHRTASETITGDKTIQQATARLYLSSTQLESTPVLPTSGLVGYHAIVFQAKDKTTQSASIRHYASTTERRLLLSVFQGSNEGNIGVIRNANGEYYGVAPTPSNSAPDTAIVTKGYSKMVTTDTAQTITGEKTFDSLSANYNMKLIENGTDLNTLIPNVTQSNIYCCNTDGTARTLVNCPTVIGFIMESSAIYSAGSDKRVIQKITDRDGYIYTRTAITGVWSDWQNLIKTPVTSAPSNSIVNKAYVESTDGTTNNLVHRSANEKVDGIKEFAYNTDKHIGTHLESTSGHWVKLVKWTAMGLRYNIVMTVISNYFRDVNFYGKLMLGAGDSTNFDHLDLISPYNWADRFKITNNGTETVLWYHNTNGQYKFGLNVFIDIECNDTDKSSRAILIPASEQVAENPNWSTFAHVLNGTYKGWGA